MNSHILKNSALLPMKVALDFNSYDSILIRWIIQEEQESVRQLIVEDKSLSWFKPKSSMPYTTQVICFNLCL